MAEGEAWPRCVRRRMRVTVCRSAVGRLSAPLEADGRETQPHGCCHGHSAPQCLAEGQLAGARDQRG